MRLDSGARAQMFLRRLPSYDISFAIEFMALAIVAWACASLFWAFVSPLGPIGRWHDQTAAAPPSSTAILASVDPFFRSVGNPAVEVATIDLTLFGVRQDRASGRGSAIIGLPDGSQASFMVGETVTAGVTLGSVDFDSVTLIHNGRRELLFLDQSSPAEAVGPPALAPPAETRPSELAPATNTVSAAQ